MNKQSTLTGKTTIVGLIGYPVSHSISPPMHNAAFAALELDWRYVPMPVVPKPDGRIGEAVRGLRALGLRGSNVTVPHKQAVMPHLDMLTPAAQAIGAVNTILVQPDGTMLGDNTDARGFVTDLKSYNVELQGKDVLILGAGGSARAVVYGLAEAGCRSIVIRNRTLSKAADLAAEMQPHFDNCTIQAVDNSGSTPDAELIVNCTSVGMSPHLNETPWDETVAFRPDQAVYDLIYNPNQSRFLQKAKADGAKAMNGLGMLLWQGAIAFELWTGQDAPVEVMREAVEGIL